jgi:hypothetical protein
MTMGGPGILQSPNNFCEKNKPNIKVNEFKEVIERKANYLFDRTSSK